MFTTTKTAHQACARCAEMASAAEGIARATGSVGGSYGDGTHSATVERVAAPTYVCEICGKDGETCAHSLTPAAHPKQDAFYAAQDARVRKDEEVQALEQKAEILEEELRNLRAVTAETRSEADTLAEAEKVAWAELEASGEYVPPVSDY